MKYLSLALSFFCYFIPCISEETSTPPEGILITHHSHEDFRSDLEKMQERADELSLMVFIIPADPPPLPDGFIPVEELTFLPSPSPFEQQEKP